MNSLEEVDERIYPSWLRKIREEQPSKTLLDMNDFPTIGGFYNLPTDFQVALDGQRQLTASIKDAECQERVERILNQIERDVYALELDLRVDDMAAVFGILQALKKQEQVSDG